MLHEQLDGQLKLVQLDPLQGQQFSVRKRDGRIAPFDETRILLALESAFRADAGSHPAQSLSDAARCHALWSWQSAFCSWFLWLSRRR